MEGPLKQHKGYLNQYRLRYCILNNAILTICKKKWGSVKGRLHIGVYNIKTDNKKLQLVLSNGIWSLQFKAESVEVLEKWSLKLKEAKKQFLEKSMQSYSVKEIDQEKRDRSMRMDLVLEEVPTGSSEVVYQPNSNMQMKDQLDLIWYRHSELSSAVNEVVQKIPKGSVFMEAANRIDTLGKDLKRNLNIFLNQIEMEQARINQMAQYMEIQSQKFERDLRMNSEKNIVIKDRNIFQRTRSEMVDPISGHLNSVNLSNDSKSGVFTMKSQSSLRKGNLSPFYSTKNNYELRTSSEDDLTPDYKSSNAGFTAMTEKQMVESKHRTTPEISPQDEEQSAESIQKAEEPEEVEIEEKEAPKPTTVLVAHNSKLSSVNITRRSAYESVDYEKDISMLDDPEIFEAIGKLNILNTTKHEIAEYEQEEENQIIEVKEQKKSQFSKKPLSTENTCSKSSTSPSKDSQEASESNITLSEEKPVSEVSIKQESLKDKALALSEQVGVLNLEQLTEMNQKTHESTNPDKIHPYVKEWLEGKVFQKYPVNTKEPIRNELPAHVDPKEKLKIMKLVKDLVGKDITKVALPCYLNEPMGAIHKACEVIGYKSAYDRAAKTEDRFLRLGLTLAASFMNYSGFVGKKKKPFNSLLGETHEFFWEDVKVITEQVSHHPPITATFSETNDYQIQADICFQPKLTVKCMFMRPEGQGMVYYKNTGDKIITKMPDTGLYNLVFGERYFHNFGTMTAINSTTGDIAEIYLKEKSFFGKPDTTCKGIIKNSLGEIKYKIEGDWTSFIDFIDAETNQRVPGLRKIPDPVNHKENYCMPLISRNANYLNESILKSACPTDTRFRPDQRALEHQDIDLASDEKFRLEQAQRRRRKERKKAGIEWEPRWFKLEFDDAVGKEIWKYKGGYFEARRTGDWGNIPKIYS